jgi:hypothetical protein
VRKPAAFVSSISDDRGEELTYAGVPISRVVEEQLGVGGTVALGAHEKRKIGVRLPESLGKQITAGLARKVMLERARRRALDAERYDAPEMEATYMSLALPKIVLNALPAS